MSYLFKPSLPMECRARCGACCIEPSINQPYFGMPRGKRAGEICTHLDLEHNGCKIWGTKDYPAVCQGFKAEIDICGKSREEAVENIRILEVATMPNRQKNTNVPKHP